MKTTRINEKRHLKYVMELTVI